MISPRTDRTWATAMISAIIRSMNTAPENDATARVSGSSRRKEKNSASAGAAIKKNSANGARSGESSGMYASTAPAPDTASAAPLATAVRSA